MNPHKENLEDEKFAESKVTAKYLKFTPLKNYIMYNYSTCLQLAAAVDSQIFHNL